MRSVILTTVLLASCARPLAPAPAAAPRAPAPAPAPSESEDADEVPIMRCFERDGDPRRWPEQAPSDGDDWDLQARYSYCTWVVSVEDGNLRAETRFHPESDEATLPFRPRVVPELEVVACVNPDGSSEPSGPLAPQRPSAVVPIGEGYLVGYDTGEFGGGLYWYDEQGAPKQKILDENLRQLVRHSDGWIAFTGLAHGLTDRGRASVIEFDGKAFHVVRRLDVLGSPVAVLPESATSLLVASGKRIVRVVDGRRVEWVHTSEEGFGVPNSLARDADGTLYLGARYFVVKLEPRPEGYRESWLAPPGATRRGKKPDY